MPVTTDDIERELQEEFERKAKQKKAQSASDASWLPDFVPQKAFLLLGAGLTCAVFMMVMPQNARFLSRTELPPLPGQQSASFSLSEQEPGQPQAPPRPQVEAAEPVPVDVSGEEEQAESSDGDTPSAPSSDGDTPSTKSEDGDAPSEKSEDGDTPSESSEEGEVAEKTSGEAEDTAKVGRVEKEPASPPSENSEVWVLATTCIKGKAVSCDAACEDQGLKCDAKTMKSVSTEKAMKSAAKAAAAGGAVCSETEKIGVGGNWDGPHIHTGKCTFSSNSAWTPTCGLAPDCGYVRLCGCKKSGKFQGVGKRVFQTAAQAPLMWWDVAVRVPVAIPGDWASETLFLDRVLRQFGKMTPGYKGPQKAVGFQPGKIFDERGMFAFDESVKSVAIDVGAATNPLPFDLLVDNSQVAFFVEPVQWKTIETDLERTFQENSARGGCGKNYDLGMCPLDRAMVFPAAVSEHLSHADFHVTANPYCGSLEAFRTSDVISKSKNADVKGIFDQCYKDAGRTRKVPTISLKAIIERIPLHIPVKYVKIDAQGHDYKVLLSAGDMISRIEYVRFEAQVDPPEGMKLVKDVPSYAEMKAKLEGLGFSHDGAHACYFDGGASRFSKETKEMECVFCRKRPCVENARPPMGPRPGTKDVKKEYVQAPPWQIPVGMETKEPK